MRYAALLALAGGSTALAAGCGGGAGMAFRGPDTVYTPYARDLADAKVGRWWEYASSGATTTLRIVGKTGEGWWIEEWTEMLSGAHGVLLLVAPDKTVLRAYNAAKGDARWNPIRVAPGTPAPPQMPLRSSGEDARPTIPLP